MRIIFLALPFMGGMFFLMAVLRGAGDSRTPFIYLSCPCARHRLNPLLIFGWGPDTAPRHRGSATATLIAQAVSFLRAGGASVQNQAFPVHTPP
jgi:Na+-driven multidrug efflux pump